MRTFIKKRITSVFIFCSIICILKDSNAQTTGDYRSKQTGAWNLSTSWQIYNGSTWINASVAPSASDGIITILSGHIITSSAAVVSDQLVINAGGTLTIDAGTFTVNDGAGIDTDCSGILAVAGGTLDGAGAVSFVSGSEFGWTGGTIGGSGIITISSGAVLNMNGGDVIFGGTKTINNYGTFTWTFGTLIFSTGSPVVNNYGTFNIYTDADQVSSGGSTGSFNNKTGGVINKIGSPTDETSFSGTISISNEGIINVMSSKLRINVSATNTGTIDVGFGANMSFAGNSTANFNTGTIITGTGNLSFEAGTNLINQATVSVSNMTISGGTVTVTPDLIIGNGEIILMTGGILNATGN